MANVTVPDVPVTIGRDALIAALESVGISLDQLRSLEITPTEMTASYIGRAPVQDGAPPTLIEVRAIIPIR